MKTYAALIALLSVILSLVGVGFDAVFIENNNIVFNCTCTFHGYFLFG
jgi:hypothetical protein